MSRKIPVQDAITQHTQQSKPKSLWSLTRDAGLEQETGLLNVRQVDEQVHNTFSQASWKSSPPPQHVRAALHYLKFNTLKPDSVITSGLLRLGQAMPEVLRDQTISAIMVQMLRPEFTDSFKVRANGAVVFMICTLLHLAWDEVDDWPTDFVMAYLEDALGPRSWCAQTDTEAFVGNILTAFRTDDPTDTMMEEKLDPVRLDDKNSSSAVMAAIDFQQYTGALALRRRYLDSATRNNIKRVTLQTMWDHLPMAMGASPSESSVRNLIKVMMTTCRWVEVRSKAMSCMDFWLGSFLKYAKPLLRFVLRQIGSQAILSREDLEAWTLLLDFRYKGRPHQIEAVKEELRMALVGRNGRELIHAGLNHIKEMEMNPNELKNPYHLDLMELFLQAIPDNSAVEFGQLIQRCTIDAALHMEGSTVSPPLAPVVLIVKRWIRHFGKRSTLWTSDLVHGLLKEGPQLARLSQKQEQRHIVPGGRNISTLWLMMLTEIVCNVMMATAIDAKDLKDIKASKFAVEHVHTFALRWFQNIGGFGPISGITSDGDVCMTPHGPIPLDALRICIARLLFLDPPQSYAMDTSSQEFDTTLIFKVIENGIPLTEAGLSALLDIRLPRKMLLSMVGEYVSRATDLSRFYPESCTVKNPEIIVKIFDLALFCETNNSQVLELAANIPLAWTQSFWACCIIAAMLASCNLRILALVVWDSMPVVRTLLEICISQHYSFPPPNYTSRTEPSSERLLRLNTEADQKDQERVLAWEKEAMVIEGEWSEARGSSTLQPSESEYAGWLMQLDFGLGQPPRLPPAEVMQQLQGANERYGLGLRLASSRDPDYLGRMIGGSDDAIWVDRLLRDVPEILDALSASTLCARYRRSTVLAHKVDDGASGTTLVENSAGDYGVKRKLIGYLEGVMDQGSAHLPASDTQNQSPRFQEVRDIFEYFLVHLCPSSILPEAEAMSIVQETKIAMGALFQGALSWPNVLLQTIRKTPGTGFLIKALQWIEAFTVTENDVQWIARSLDFILRIDGREADETLEQCLLTIGRLLISRPFVFDWLGQEKEPLLRELVKKVDRYFVKYDALVGTGSIKDMDTSEAMIRDVVQVELSNGEVMSTHPEILRLALLILSTEDVDKQVDSTWGRLLCADSIVPRIPKRLKNGSALLSCNPPFPSDMQFRLKLVQISKDPEVVRVATDGLTLVQVIDISGDAFGADNKTAQVVHEALLMAIEQEKSYQIPIHLDMAVLQKLSLILKYYGDQGNHSSVEALAAVRARFSPDTMTIQGQGPGPGTIQTTPAALPDFFHDSIY
ncbi:hypothetical protein B0O80DRAFT_43185 [Mortierella sp. GBAus27b]|nr:hypothetical protein B0O80DRAFT_43185 [Mortierella sp. GBAus27b]